MVRAALFTICLLFACACGGGTDADAGSGPTDAGGSSDAALSDAAPSDAGSMDSDAGTSDGDGGLLCDDLGKPCESDGDCGGGYTCDTFRRACLPPMTEERPFCGGFAGAPCPTTGMYTQCSYLTSADIGPCLTPTEAACACMPPARAHFSSCPP